MSVPTPLRLWPADPPKPGDGSQSIKAISLHQPWASLVAMGIKGVETRSWTTRYRGPLAIHASKNARPWLELWVEAQRNPESPSRALVDPIFATTGAQGWRETPRGIEANSWPADGPLADSRGLLLPLGAVVCVCSLVDVVPIVERAKAVPGAVTELSELDLELDYQGGSLVLVAPDGTPARIEEQRPYGNFQPGRYAWILADVKPLREPVPVKGKQGLWDWGPVS